MAGYFQHMRKMLEAKNGRIFSFDPIIFIQLKIQKGHRGPQKKNTDFEPKIERVIEYECTTM